LCAVVASITSQFSLCYLCGVADYHQTRARIFLFCVNFVWVLCSLNSWTNSRIIIISYDDDDDDDKEDDKEEEGVSRRKRRKTRVNTRRTHQSKEKEEEYVDSTGVTNYCVDWWQACVIIASAEKFEKDFDANALHLKGRTTT